MYGQLPVRYRAREQAETLRCAQWIKLDVPLADARGSMKGDVKDKLLLDRRSGSFFLTASSPVFNSLLAFERALILKATGSALTASRLCRICISIAGYAGFYL